MSAQSSPVRSPSPDASRKRGYNESEQPSRKRGRPRGTAKLKYITDPTRRINTVTKRKNSLIKKAEELATVGNCQLMIFIVTEVGTTHRFATPDFRPLVESPTNIDFVTALRKTYREKGSK
jgi:hypothetical protein